MIGSSAVGLKPQTSASAARGSILRSKNGWNVETLPSMNKISPFITPLLRPTRLAKQYQGKLAAKGVVAYSETGNVQKNILSYYTSSVALIRSWIKDYKERKFLEKCFSTHKGFPFPNED